MEIVADSADGLGRTPAGLQQCLGSMLTAFERSVGFAEGVVMSFDPDVLLPNAFAATVVRGLDDSLVACRNEQLDHDFLKFRDLAAGPVRVGTADRETDPRADVASRAARADMVSWADGRTALASRHTSAPGASSRTGHASTGLVGPCERPVTELRREPQRVIG